MRALRVFAWAPFGLSVVFGVGFLFLVYLHRTSPGPLEYTDGSSAWLINSVYFLLGVTYPLIGALIASRHPRNAIGWLFCLTGVAISAGFFFQLYADYTLFNEPGSLPGGEIALWASSHLSPLGLFVSPIFLMLLFPDGAPASRFWAWVVRAAATFVVLGMMGAALAPGRVEPVAMKVDNPFALAGAWGQVAGSLESMFELTAGVWFLLALTSISRRFRRSRGTERVQLKWIVYTASVMTAAFGLAWFATIASQPLMADIFFLIGALALIAVPVTSGLAILRYRLYEIDVIVNRTLVYGLLTALLAFLYLSGVVVLQRLLEPLTVDSDLAVAGSTLAVAALFRPLRARVQSFIDRRFYRSKYDAAETLERFSSRLRDEVELESLSNELVTVVGSTMQPAHASLWLKPTQEGAR